MTQTDTTYNYIIIGAGASGCVIANRLSADPSVKVLVLEAGGRDINPDIANVGGFVRLWGSDIDSVLHTTPQQGMFNREITLNQGKVLGGSSSINAMMYVRGNAENFDEWAAVGATGWSYEDVLPYFKRIENYKGGDAGYHGTAGEVSLSDCPDSHMRSPEFIEAAKQAGYNEPHWDYNGAKQSNSAGYLQFHIGQNKKRESGATAFLHPVMDRANLTVLTGAVVKKVIINENTATGIEYVVEGQAYTANATNEVILSSGAFGSPKLLMLSGIGPAGHLKELGIDVVKDMPGVGQNLQDHLQLPVIFKTDADLPHTTLLTGNVLFVKTNNQVVSPDIQINFTPSMPAPLAPVLPDFGSPICIFLAILVQPKSTGEVKLSSADYEAQPVINPNYLQDEADVEALSKAVGIIRDIAVKPAFAHLNIGEIVPGGAPIEDFIRSQSSTLWHPASTCKMGNDAMAVVDERLRVKGISHLRVADASVMPVVTSGNTVATCFMIGERAAEMILEDNN